MATTNQFESELLAMRRELRELKTAQQLSPRIRSYTTSFTLGELPGDDEKPRNCVKITYESGSGDILTEFTSDLSIWPGVPDGNEQYVNLLAYTGSAMMNAPVFVMSTRPILSVELVQ